MSKGVFQVNHRHVILTIDEGLRERFMKHSEVLNFDAMDEGDPEVPPPFSCANCGGEMS